MKVVKATNLSKIYGGKYDSNSTTAINNISLQIEEGEFIAVMGPSGSGKTTLLNILSGIDKPTSGNVEIAGQNINNLTKDELGVFRRQKIGFVFQDFNLLDSLSLKENIILPLILDKKSLNDIEDKAKDIMVFFEIEDIANKYPYNVSGGQQQRAAVSRAIINDPAVIFADEPTGNLDSKASSKVMKSFERINQERNGTILMVTHDPFAASFCKRVVFIKDGEIHSEIVRKNGRKEFFENIIDVLAVLGGERYDL